MDDTNNITAIHGNPAQLGEMFAALSKAQSEIDPAKKRALNPHFKSRYADLSSCLDAVLPALNKHGLSLHTSLHCLVFRWIKRAGHKERVAVSVT